MSKKYTVEELVANESFRQWVQGIISNQSTQYWDSWIEANPQQIHIIIKAMSALGGWQFNKQSLSDEELDKEFTKLRSRLYRGSLKTFRIAPIWYAAAASLLFTLGASLYLLTNGWSTTTYYATDFGKGLTVSFDDGTIINLAANSKLAATRFLPWQPAREIKLEGEAYFQVASHPENEQLKKFIVYTNDANIVVLGTKFSVNSRHNHTEVLLNEGSVQVQKTAESLSIVTLKPGEFLSTNDAKTEKLEPKQPANSRVYTSWKDGYLEFEKASIQDVISRIEDLYGLKVILSDKTILAEEITGKVPAKNLNELFSSLNRLFNLETEIKNDTVFITKSK
jgi:ferric-dicitrate binding protein FerR (iron transport regulator)